MTRRLSRYLLASIALSLAACSDEPPPRTAVDWAARSCDGCNLILISFDTLRADHLGTYGYGRATSPTIDRLAESAVVFENCIAQSGTTLPSHFSLLTSLYPSHHGVVYADSKLPDETTTLADVLHDHDYQTAAFTGGGWVREQFGYHTFDRFEHSAYYDTHNEANEHFPRMLRWLEEQESPFFLFWHTYRVHSPYEPAPEFDAFVDPSYDGLLVTDPESPAAVCQGPGVDTFKCNWKGKLYFDLLMDRLKPSDISHVVDKYDGEILQADRMLADLMALLEKTGQADNTVIIFTSDHGETFADRPASRFIGHGVLYNEVIRVPLIISLPGLRGPIHVDRMVESIDIMPTALQLLGLRTPGRTDGESLLAEPGALPAVPIARSEQIVGREGHMQVVLAGDLKLIRRFGGGLRTELYDLAADPGELRNLYGQGHPQEDDLLALLPLPERGTRAASAEGDELDEELIRELKSLGYL